MTDVELFANEIIAATAALPGWTVRVRHTDAWKCDDECDPKVDHCPLDGVHLDRTDHGSLAVAAWATVKRCYRDGETRVEVEPLFVISGRLTNESEYRRMHSDLTPVTKVHHATTIGVDVIPPAGDAS